jgi:hypothetical protein
MASKNETILRKQDEAMSKGDMDAFWAAFADDVVVHVGGRSKLAGDVKGVENLQQTFANFMQGLGDDVVFDTHDILANDTHGIVLQSFTGERGGERRTFQGVSIFHFTGGKITEAWFIDVDPYAADPWYDAGLK